jgi:hypothetical protein
MKNVHEFYHYSKMGSNYWLMSPWSHAPPKPSLAHVGQVISLMDSFRVSYQYLVYIPFYLFNFPTYVCIFPRG